MSLSLIDQWKLVASGLVAHADGVLDGEECDRLMAAVDEAVEGDDYSDWLTIVGDHERLRQALEALATPPPESHRVILEQAWTMSIVDGQRCEAEHAVIEELASRLGVEPMQLDFWREAWTAGEHETAETVAAALAWVLGGDEAPTDDARIRHTIAGLPTTDDHRETLVRLASRATSREHVIRALGGLTRRKRRWALGCIAPAVSGTTHEAEAERRFVELAAELGIPASEADALLRA
jgi:tellurite resistance protein